LSRALGFGVGSPVAQASTLIAAFVFYMGMRRIKLSGSQLRQRDRRAPVLILRQFGDDFLESGRMSLGAVPTFEHFLAVETRLYPINSLAVRREEWRQTFRR
jgi:hypothetical protein